MRPGLAAALLVALLTPLFMLGASGHAIHNGDEAIYAEMAREMRDGGDFGTLHWQGEPQFPRPPLVVWILAAVGPSHLRALLALVCAVEVALVLVLGWLCWGPVAGVTAAGVLAGSDLFLGYSRYFESEPFLCVAVLASFICWERRRYLGWGLFLGLALMVKQLVGGLPLLALLLDRRREARAGLWAAALVWLPWHVFTAAQHGWAFVDSYLLQNIVARSALPMLHTTRAWFYLRELWRSEGPLALVFAAALLWASVEAVRRRRPAERLVAVWALVVLVVYSLARSRYDYYLLLAYPAFVLCVGAGVARLPRLKWAAATALIATALALHAPHNLGEFAGEDEQRALVEVANQRLAPPARLYAYNTHAYAARFYSQLDVTTLLESTDDLRAAAELRRAGMPSSVLPAPDLPAALRELPRPFALLMPRARESILPSGLALLGESKHYLLLEGR